MTSDRQPLSASLSQTETERRGDQGDVRRRLPCMAGQTVRDEGRTKDDDDAKRRRVSATYKRNANATLSFNVLAIDLHPLPQPMQSQCATTRQAAING